MAKHLAEHVTWYRRIPKRRALLAAGGVVIIAAGTVAAVLSTGGTPKKPAATHRPTTHRHKTVAVDRYRCPLDDAPSLTPVPNRPALAIKIGNEPDGARPQSGLNEADVIFDTPAEGFIMRYIAVFQCNTAPTIGPVRSVRWVDWHLVSMLGHPILTFAGGINPNVNTVMALPWLTAANVLEGAQDAAHRISSRVPPDNLYTSTTALYGMFKTLTGPPKPIFSFSSAALPDSVATSGLRIDFSGGTDVVWEWDAKARDWVHTYSGQRDIDASTNKPVTTTNIVAISATYSFGPYAESLNGSGDFESVTTGSGTGYVLRGGRSVKVTWSRPSTTDPWTFTDQAGHVITLAPGRVWVEIVPDTTFNSSSFALVK